MKCKVDIYQIIYSSKFIYIFILSNIINKCEYYYYYLTININF